MRILGIDYGDRRIGLAICDSGEIIAAGLPTIERAGPSVDVSQGPRAKLSIEFAQRLGQALGIEAETWDERLTTVQADRLMLGADLSREKRKVRRDRIAAQLLLQSYLDARRRKQKTDAGQ